MPKLDMLKVGEIALMLTHIRQNFDNGAIALSRPEWPRQEKKISEVEIPYMILS